MVATGDHGLFISMGFNMNRALRQARAARLMEEKKERRRVGAWVRWYGARQPVFSAEHSCQSPSGAVSRSQRASLDRPLVPIESERLEIEETSLLGWSVSAFIHGSVLAIAAVVNFHVGGLLALPQKELFRWDVSLMAAPEVESIVADSVRQQEIAVEKELDFQPAVDKRQVEQVSEYADHQDESPVSDAAVGESPPQSNTRQASSMPGDLIVSEDYAANTASPVVVSPAASPLPPPEIESQFDSNSFQVSARPENPAVLQRPKAVSRSVMTRTAFPDYTWLMDTLRTKLEQVKIYPSSAKASHSQGRVVVRVSIRSNGRILDSEIEESSGYPVLDQAALDALQAASPLTLAHSLDGDSVVMLVPLSYQLE